MPEGLEVYVLSKVLKDLGFECESYGKHLLIKNFKGEKYDISFGLGGKIFIDENMEIKKITKEDVPCGEMILIKSFEDAKEKLGIDWIRAKKEDIVDIVDSWKNRKKQIGALLLEQNEICGIGVAWASEILYYAKIHPTEKANTLEFLGVDKNLVDAIILVRDFMIKKYMNVLDKNNKKFVNEWFENLYKIREKYLKVYRKGQEIKLSGRNFYIKNLV